MRLLPALGVTLAVLGAAATERARADTPALAETQVIALPGVQKRIDHFAIDPSSKRLFVASNTQLLECDWQTAGSRDDRNDRAGLVSPAPAAKGSS